MFWFQSGTDRSSRGSRLGSTSDIRGENGEIDYKKLYEETLRENDRLKEKLRKSDEELRDTKQTLERLTTVVSEMLWYMQGMKVKFIIMFKNIHTLSICVKIVKLKRVCFFNIQLGVCL